MKATSKIKLLLLLSWFAVACSSPVKVTTDYDSKTDFSKFKSFSFYQLTDKSSGLSELNQQRIINAIKAELIKKGFVENVNNPDLLVNATAIVTEKQQVTATNYYNYGGYYRPYYWGPTYVGPTVYNVKELREGSLVIDVIDASTKHLLWQSTGNKEIDTGLKSPETEIPAAVTKILAYFPPGSKKK
jgi:hypothetical protein